jgi:hypothetical protein
MMWGASRRSRTTRDRHPRHETRVAGFDSSHGSAANTTRKKTVIAVHGVAESYCPSGRRKPHAVRTVRPRMNSHIDWRRLLLQIGVED